MFGGLVDPSVVLPIVFPECLGDLHWEAVGESLFAIFGAMTFVMLGTLLPAGLAKVFLVVHHPVVELLTSGALVTTAEVALFWSEVGNASPLDNEDVAFAKADVGVDDGQLDAGDDGDEVVNVVLATTLIMFDGKVNAISDIRGMRVVTGDRAADGFELVNDHVGLVDATEVAINVIIEASEVVAGEEGAAFCEFFDFLLGAHLELLDHDVVGSDGSAKIVTDGEEWVEEGLDKDAKPTIGCGHSSEGGGRNSSVPFGVHVQGRSGWWL